MGSKSDMHEEPELLCDEIESDFSNHLEGELSGERSRAMDRHFDTCEACARGYAQFRSALNALGAYPLQAPPRAFYESIAARTGERTRRRLPFGAALPWALAAAGIGCAAWLQWVELPNARDVARSDRQAVGQMRESVRERVVEKDVIVPVTVDIRGAGLEHKRGDRVAQLSAGDRVTLLDGDTLVVAAATIIQRPIIRRPIVIDTDPLAKAFDGAVRRLAGLQWPMLTAALERPRLELSVESMLRPVSEALANIRFEPSPSTTPRPQFEQPAHDLIANRPPTVATENLGHETILTATGSTSDIVPTLLLWLDSGDPNKVALAQARLSTIQKRLEREFGIPAPGPLPRGSKVNAIDDVLVSVFDTRSARPEQNEPQSSQRWRRWWAEHRSRLSEAPRVAKRTKI